MPALSAGMEEGTIARWLKPVGAAVAKGDVLVEIETDKATMEYEAEEGGVLGAIMASDGATVPVNAVIAMLLLEGEDDAALTRAAEMPAATVPPAAMPAPEPEVARPRRIAASPLARRLARQRGIALDGLSGSGARGRIVRIDIERASQTAVAAPAAVVAPPASPSVAQPSAPSRHEAHSAGREWGVVPHLYLNASCEMDALIDLRARLNEAGGGTYTLLVNDFVIRAAALALRMVPEVNACWTDGAIYLLDNIDISLGLTAGEGVITPIVRRADRKGLAAISAEARDLAGRARAGTLQPADHQGGGLTVSNLGDYGVESFGAIVNPPQSCALAVGAVERRAVVRGDACVPATMMTCTLSVDHRSVDATVAARWLAAFKALIEQPLRLVA